MNTKSIIRLLPAALLLAGSVSLRADEQKTIRHSDRNHVNVRTDRDDDENVEKEKVTFLGVETAPVGNTLATQLGLAEDMGLVVVRVSKDSPSSNVLKEHDILLKFEDQ